MLSIRSPLILATPLLLSLAIQSASAKQMRTTWYDCPFSPMCVANREYPKGTILRLFNPKTGKTTYGVVRDFGPERRTGRSLDVSRQIAERLGMIRDGVAMLEVSVVRP